LTGDHRRDLTPLVSEGVSVKLSRQERVQVVEWFARHQETLPAPIRLLLAEPLARLTSSDSLSQKAFNTHGRQLARALGLIPSSERRRSSGRPLNNAKAGKSRRGTKQRTANNGRAGPAEVKSLRAYTRSQQSSENVDQITKETEVMREEAPREGGQGSEPNAASAGPTEHQKISQAEFAKRDAQARAFVARAQLGEGPDPALTSSHEALMNADVVCIDEDDVLVPADLPEGLHEEDVVKTLIQPRTRYDFALTVTEIQLDVEKKVVVTKDGERRIISGSTHEYGPKGFAVTWQALATLVVMIGQFAMPLNRLGTMLSTATKKFTSTSLGRMAHYVAERLAPIYLVLMEQLADSDILAGDDTSCRVLEISSYYARARQAPEQAEKEPPPWRSYGTVEEANATYIEYTARKSALLARREEGDREAKRTAAEAPPLKVLIGRELPFESPLKSGDGPKQAINTTVVTGRTDADDPSSQIVFYRSHLGSFGNLLEMLLSRRKPSKRKLIVQADLSTTNTVSDPHLTSRFDIEAVGCSAHARRPFAQYEDQDPKYAAMMLALFGALAVHEDTLDDFGRNRENVLAVRNMDSRPMWERIKAACETLSQRWTKATPIGNAARYIVKHYEKLTAYLNNPRLEATNNLRERMLRTEKLIEKSSMFRQSIEGRAVLDVLRTILQTAVAAGVGPHEYLVNILKADPEDIEARPERYTPAAWAKQRSPAHAQATRDQPAA
jgi:hypothetical protein